MSGTSNTSEHNMLLPPEFVAPVTETTFSYQSSLPALPVPTLQHTLDYYLQSVKPHVTDEKYEDTKQKVEDFQHGVGKQLHEKLMEKAKTERNWIEQWWEDKAYLEARTPLAPFCNFVGNCPEYPLGTREQQFNNTALNVWYMIQYFRLVRSERLVVDKAGRKKPFDMDQVRGLFCSYHYPGEKCDKLKSYFKTDKEGACSSHIVVLCRGYVYSMCSEHTDRSILTVPELCDQLRYIHTHAHSMKDYGPSIGALTAEDRTVWSKLRHHLLSLSSVNTTSLHTIETSIFAVALDDDQPANITQKAYLGLAGDAKNRWFDKSLTCIGFHNGAVTTNFDHAHFEGIIAVSLIHYIHRGTHNGTATWQGSSTIRQLERPIQLQFVVDDRITQGVTSAIQLLQRNASLVEIHLSMFDEFGKSDFKKYKFHPDAFIQIALQLAYYKVHKRVAPTYETGTARLFWHGRTETVRTCTQQLAQYCTAMCQPDVSDVEKLRLLQSAYHAHMELMSSALQFQGCDRHLLGLMCVAQELNLPLHPLYTDTAFTKSGGGGNFVLSTSCAGYYDFHGGMPPMTKDGYGVFYLIQDHSFRVFISRWTQDVATSCTKLNDALFESFRDIKQLLDRKDKIIAEAKTGGAKL